MNKINNRKDLLLLLLYSPILNGGEANQSIVGRTRLVKMLFLFKEEVWQHFKKGIEIKEENFYKFFAWNFGPFSVEVYDDITFFILNGFVEACIAEQELIIESASELEFWESSEGYNSDNNLNEYQEEEFKLTEKGVNFTIQLYKELTTNQKELLQQFKSKLSSTPLRSILQYVYKKYPTQITNSIIKDDILRNQP